MINNSQGNKRKKKPKNNNIPLILGITIGIIIFLIVVPTIIYGLM